MHRVRGRNAWSTISRSHRVLQHAGREQGSTRRQGLVRAPEVQYDTHRCNTRSHAYHVIFMRTRAKLYMINHAQFVPGCQRMNMGV
jgi:hypothetical protein